MDPVKNLEAAVYGFMVNLENQTVEYFKTKIKQGQKVVHKNVS